jgi:hypothetical protein
MDESLPGLEAVLDRLVDEVFNAQTSNGYEAEIKRGVERAIVNQLMDLAASAPMTQVRAIATLTLKRLQAEAEAPMTGSPTSVQAHRGLLASDITRFMERPFDSMQPASVPNPPPGAPIGDVGLDYLLGVEACDWFDVGWRR